ncbi:AsmA-like C-terminal region-containing protein [Cytophagaceae bacterium YF14B1]|uniref:AsmA-like C-terminal region-containing protein n=1 Tax=Xanthocytophaga flava TaxID=3048013 RepID=A0AAE3QV95_9BACT|nr:AsmA-like C-terminal region-containing protein [Xanthocytophaga flavus]MDJ1483173.1 AsmA-like C-terminal region-containing protein [Xanthocytophaga flavus]
MTVAKGFRIFFYCLLILTTILAALLWTLPRFYEERAASYLRKQFALYSDLRLQHFTTRISLFSHFPHVTFTFEQLSVVDTTFSVPLQVLGVKQAKFTVNLQDIKRDTIPLRNIQLKGIRFYQEIDSVGHKTGFRFKKRKASGSVIATPARFEFPQIEISDVQVRTLNKYKQSAFSVLVKNASLSANYAGDSLLVKGTFQGESEYIKNQSITLFQGWPFTATAHYVYNVKEKKGTLYKSAIQVHQDTISIMGTHKRSKQGVSLAIDLQGQLGLTELLNEALPGKLKPYLAQVSSNSKVKFHYSITGNSSPTLRPHTHLAFVVTDGNIAWSKSLVKLKHIDLRGELDNGKDQTPRTSYIRISSFRCQTDSNTLEGNLQVTNFDYPSIKLAVQGHLAIPVLATIADIPNPSSYQGSIRGNMALEGPLHSPIAGYFSKKLKWNGTLTIQNGSWVGHNTFQATHVNADMQFANNLLQIQNLHGRINNQPVSVSGTIQNLLAYIVGFHPVVNVVAIVNARQVNTEWFQGLFVASSLALPHKKKTLVHTAHSSITNLIQHTTLLPPFIQTDIKVQCNELLVGNDTIHNLNSHLQSTETTLNFTHLAGSWRKGKFEGKLYLPNDLNKLNQSNLKGIIQIDDLDLKSAIGQRLSNKKNFLSSLPYNPSVNKELSPYLQALIQGADIGVTLSVSQLRLPGEENIQKLMMQIQKKNEYVNISDLKFETTLNGKASGSGRFRLLSQPTNSIQILDPLFSLKLTYNYLNLEKLMKQIAAIGHLLPRRISGKAEKNISSVKSHSIYQPWVIFPTNYQVDLEVESDRLHYYQLNGYELAFKTRIYRTHAIVDDFGIKAFDGKIALQGTINWSNRVKEVPVHLRAKLQRINLYSLFKAADELNLDLLHSHNIRGDVDCNLSVHTKLDNSFAPRLSQTTLYSSALIRNMELINVEPLQQALRFVKKKKTEHMYFNDVHAHFLFSKDKFFTPGVKLDNNISEFKLSGSYTMNGPADLYLDLNIFEVLFGNNKKRIERIQQDADTLITPKKQHLLVYRQANGVRTNSYKVKFFSRKERNSIDKMLNHHFREQLLEWKIDTVFSVMQKINLQK